LQELRKELDAHGALVSSLCEASPVLVEHCSPSDRVSVQSELNHVTEQWEEISAAWKKRKVDLDEVQVTTEQFHKAFDALVDWLNHMEQKLADQPPVGTELEEVKEQLNVHKVTGCYLGNDMRQMSRGVYFNVHLEFGVSRDILFDLLLILCDILNL